MKNAAASGFSDTTRIENEKAFDSMREDVGFKQAIEDIKKNRRKL